MELWHAQKRELRRTSRTRNKVPIDTHLQHARSLLISAFLTSDSGSSIMWVLTHADIR